MKRFPIQIYNNVGKGMWSYGVGATFSCRRAFNCPAFMRTFAGMEKDGDITSYYKKAFKQGDYQEKLVENRSFDNCLFTGCNFNNATFYNCRFDNCVFDSCDLSLLNIKFTSFYKVAINNSKAIGIKWFEASNPLDVNFTNTVISYSSFFGKSLKKNKLVDCTAEDVDFTDCNCTQANFSGTSLPNARFFNTDLSQSDFTTARNYNIDPKTNKLKKAKFSLPEAASFLYHLGIELV